MCDLFREYAVVGILEEMSVTREVLEARVPLFLRGLSKLSKSE